MNNEELITKLRLEVAEAPDPEWIDIIWEKLYAELKECLLHKDPRNFLDWRVVCRTMHHGGEGKAARGFFTAFRKHPAYKNWVKREIITKNTFSTDTEFDSVQHAMHLLRFQDATCLQIKDMKYILEFGAGYGNMRRIIHNLGFPGTYVIYDMPIMCILQKFYLGTLGIDTEFHSRFDSLQSDVQHFISESSLFIATFSLSEAPLDARYLIEDLVKDFKGILISCAQNMGDRVNNKAHFREWADKMQQHTWRMIPVKENRTGGYYFFGVIE